MKFISAAWKLVSSSTINNYFPKAGALLEETATHDDDGGGCGSSGSGGGDGEVVSDNEQPLLEGADFDTFVHFDYVQANNIRIKQCISNYKSRISRWVADHKLISAS